MNVVSNWQWQIFLLFPILLDYKNLSVFSRKSMVISIGGSDVLILDADLMLELECVLRNWKLCWYRD